MLIRTRAEKNFIAHEAPIAGNDIGLDDFKRKADVRIGVYIGERGRQIKIFSRHFLNLLRLAIVGKALFGESLRFFLVDIGHEFLYRGGYWDRKQYSQKTSEFCAHNERQYHEKWRHADDFFDDNGIDKVRLELLDDDIKPSYQKQCGEAAVREGNRKGRNCRQNLTEDRNKFKYRSKHRKKKGVGHAQYH